MKKKLVIAIDGPVGSGKGTLAVALAKRLGAFYVYTGGMYRALAYACLKQNVNVYDEAKVLEVLQKISLVLQAKEYGTVISINGREIFDEMFLPEVTKIVPIVAAMPAVRREMVARQQKVMEGKSVVVEGRDSATDVAPRADLKIYLTANINTRAKRRVRQLKKRDLDVSFAEVLEQIRERDRQDTERKASPLTRTPDAYIIDTTDLTIEETVEQVIAKLKEKKLI